MIYRWNCNSGEDMGKLETVKIVFKAFFLGFSVEIELFRAKFQAQIQQNFELKAFQCFKWIKVWRNFLETPDQAWDYIE